MTASTPRRAEPSRPSSVDRDAAATGADDDEAGRGERVDRGGVDDGRRLRRGDHPAPALLAAVLPDLAECDEPLRLLAREEAADRLGRLAEARVVDVDEGAGDQAGGALREAAGDEGRVQLVGEREGDGRLGLGDAPVQRDRRDDVRGQLVLDQQVADLRTVAVGQHDLDAGRDDVGDVAGRLAERVPLGAGRRRPVGTGHGVAAEGDHDTARSHGATLAGFLLAVKYSVGWTGRSAAPEVERGRGRAGSRPPRRRRPRGRTSARRRSGRGRRCRS